MTIVWDTFERAARATARMKGLPQARFVVTRGRRGADTEEDQRAKARAAAAEIAAQLLAS